MNSEEDQSSTNREVPESLNSFCSDQFARAPSEHAEALYQEARAYYALKKYDYMEMINKFRKAAEQGHAEAAYLLGIFYMSGDGFPQDNEQAYHWYRKAAEQGHCLARVFMGHRYEKGCGVPQDYAQAAYWYRLGAEQGDYKDAAQQCLEKLYKEGHAAP